MAGNISGLYSRTFTNLSVPSVILADDAAEEEMTEAAEEEMTPWYDTGVVWYGSLRGVVSSGGDKDASSSSGSSRWGIKGSSEVSEGLTAVYQFESRLGQGKGSQDTNVLLAGLSGGFGSLTVGKFNNAAYLSGGMRDVGNAFGGGDVNSKVGSTVSYAYATDAFNLQADAIMDGGADTGKSIDEVQFGMVVNLGDFGKVALGYENREDSMADGMAVKMLTPSTLTAESTPDNLVIDQKTGKIKDFDKIVWRTAVASGHKQVTGTVSNVMYSGRMSIVKVAHAHADAVPPAGGEVTKNEDGTYTHTSCAAATTACTKSAYVWVTATNPSDLEDTPAGEDPTATLTVASAPANSVLTATVTPMKTTYGHKASHITAAFGLGAVTVRLGHTSKDSNDPMMTAKAKTNYLGFTGSIGDTGMDWRAFGRNMEDHAGKETSPWAIGVGKDLGGGAYTYIEHGNEDDGKAGTTNIGLNVSF